MNTQDDKISQAYSFLSNINRQAYRDIYLLSNQVLSKNPFTNNFLDLYVKGANVKVRKLSVFLKLVKYYLMSLKDFVSYVLEAVEFFLSGVRFRHKNDELIIIDSFFIISSIQKSKVFQDRYFSKLVDSLNKAGKNKRIYEF